MKPTSAIRILLATAAFAGAAEAGQIARTAVNLPAIFNNYSVIQPGMPNYGVAQGAIVQIYGTGLALATSKLQNVPLPTTLNGASVQITVNGVTTQAILYYVSSTQIDAIIPSATPVGTGQIAVTVKGAGTGAPMPITIVQSAFGMLSLNNAGNGPAAVFDLNSNYVNLTNAANPGDFITLWGTGLGPVTGDETLTQQPANLTDIPIEVDIGGRPAFVQYHGRSQYPGLDQINVQVPQGVAGCYVSLVVRTGNIESNFGTVPVAASGRTCSDLAPGASAVQIQTLSSQAVVKAGVIDFLDFSADAHFLSYTNAQFAGTQPGLPASLNDCTVLNYTSAVYPSAALPILNVPNPLQGTPLDAGPSITLAPPSGSGIGSQTLPFENGAYYIDGFTATGSLGGAYTFANGSGGADVGPFTAQVVWPGGGGGFNFSTPGNATSVNRADGLPLTWNQPSHTDPSEFIEIYGFSFAQGAPFGAEFTCFVPLAAHQFTIPPAVLLALPSQAGVAGMPPAVLEVNLVISKQFTAPGLDVATINFVSENVEAFHYD